MARRGRGARALYRVHLSLAFLIVFSFCSYMEAFAEQVRADELEQPQQDVILTVEGLLANHNGQGHVKLDRPMIERIGLNELTTHTVYSTKAYQWHGVLMRDLLDYVGAQGKTVMVQAMDGYRTSIPIQDFHDYDVLLATKRNGQDLNIRSRGPVRLIYPLDHDASLLDPKYTARFVWQIEKIVVQ